MLFDGEKPQIVALIDEEFKKYEGQKPPAPIRFKKSAPGDGVAGEENGGEDRCSSPDEGEDDAPNVADLIPRKDIR